MGGGSSKPVAGHGDLINAATNGDINNLERILQDKDLDIDALCIRAGSKALVSAIKHGHLDCVQRLLLQNNIILNGDYHKHYIPLTYAAEVGKRSVKPTRVDLSDL
jgi:hypothetical protein